MVRTENLLIFAGMGLVTYLPRLWAPPRFIRRSFPLADRLARPDSGGDPERFTRPSLLTALNRELFKIRPELLVSIPVLSSPGKRNRLSELF